jgi:carboxyl-terminal processing protease
VPPAPHVNAELVDGTIAKVRFDGFYPGAAEDVLKAIADLQATTDLTGIIIDVRGNHGGDPAEDAQLLGAFIHHATYASFCDVHDKCDPQRVDDTTPLLNLPLVTLADDVCASACDAFAMAVKDLHLGTLIGTRTAGIASGPAADYQLNDHITLIGFPTQHAVGANGEIFDGIGVPPDYDIPLTAADLSKGQDPALTKAVSLLGS